MREDPNKITVTYGLLMVSQCFSKLEIISSLSLISFIGKLNIIVNNNYINIVYTCSGIPLDYEIFSNYFLVIMRS